MPFGRLTEVKGKYDLHLYNLDLTVCAQSAFTLPSNSSLEKKHDKVKEPPCSHSLHLPLFSDSKEGLEISSSVDINKRGPFSTKAVRVSV